METECLHESLLQHDLVKLDMELFFSQFFLFILLISTARQSQTSNGWGVFFEYIFCKSSMCLNHLFIGCADLAYPVFRWDKIGHYLKVVIVHLAVMLVVVWVVHFIEEINSEPPCQTYLGYIHVLRERMFKRKGIINLCIIREK